jgi:hypothetical protein
MAIKRFDGSSSSQARRSDIATERTGLQGSLQDFPRSNSRTGENLVSGIGQTVD